MLLPDATLEQATEVLERLRRITPQGQTFSAGLVGWDGQEASDRLVARAGGRRGVGRPSAGQPTHRIRVDWLRDRADGDGATGRQRTKPADRPGNGRENAGNASEGRHDKPGKDKPGKGKGKPDNGKGR